jgi:hypothetical protein
LEEGNEKQGENIAVLEKLDVWTEDFWILLGNLHAIHVCLVERSVDLKHPNLMMTWHPSFATIMPHALATVDPVLVWHISIVFVAPPMMRAVNHLP